MRVANEVTGKFYSRYNDVEYYFKLKRTNDSLVKANEMLYNKLKQDFEMPDTINKTVNDSVKIDSLLKFRKYNYMAAKVIGNSVILPNNYLQLHRGELQGVEKDLGVIDPNNAVVGTVIDVSPNNTIVMSLLHKQSSISAKLKNNGESGTIVWDGLDPHIVLMKEVNKSVKVTKGDSVVTSGFTDRFPYGLLIGRVQQVISEKSSNKYLLKIRTAANFSDLQYVYIINNLQKREPAELLKKAQKTNE